jgi:hypothetical protein
MAQQKETDEAAVREILISAVEVQLSALKAAASFWREWMEQTSDFVKSASNSLNSIRSGDKNANEVLLEVVDAGRGSIRSMTELPRSAAERFIVELDEFEKKKQAKSRQATKGKTSSGSGKSSNKTSTAKATAARASSAKKTALKKGTAAKKNTSSSAKRRARVKA